MGALIGTARADSGPQTYSNSGAQTSGDIVCVGSDTVQFIGNFAADGDYVGHAGYNASGASRKHDKLVSLDATGDANARFSYGATQTFGATPVGLDPTVVLRQGQRPVQRPNGSSAGYNALVNDVTTTGRDEQINCARGSALPNATQFNTAIANGWGGLHVARVATETLGVVVNGQFATDTTTSCSDPAGLSTAQLVQIYTNNNLTWSGVTGWTNPDATCGAHTIHPLLPQPGSGTRNKFLSDLGITAAQLAPYVNQAVEENDPFAITGDSAPRDAIVAFSGSRLNLWNGTGPGTTVPPGTPGYFSNPHTPYPGSASLDPNAHLNPVTGTAGDAGADFRDDRGLFFAWRASDDNDACWNGPGNTLSINWVHALFLGANTSYFGTVFQSRNAVQAAGATWAYLDCGINPATCGGGSQAAAVAALPPPPAGPQACTGIQVGNQIGVLPGNTPVVNQARDTPITVNGPQGCTASWTVTGSLNVSPYPPPSPLAQGGWARGPRASTREQSPPRPYRG